MQSFRRLYATLPDAAAAARTASTPRAVRLRRLRKTPTPGQTDATAEGLTPTEYARYHRQLAKGELVGKDGQNLTEGEWLDKLNSRRMRIRGVRETVAEDGTRETQVVGQKVYLPNIIFRLVRNHTPSGQPYNPYEATFRIPQSVTKTDVRSYLAAVYGVKTTYIRTDNYLSPVTRSRDASWTNTQSYKTYKRAVVGLVDPFYYPLAIEDMNETERQERREWIEKNFQTQMMQDARKLEMLRISRKGSKGWKWRTGTTAQRGNILRRISEHRAAREQVVAEAKSRMQESREKGEAAV